LVRANANDATATLVTINQLSPIYVTFGVPQQYLGVLTRYRATGTLKVSVYPPGIDEKPEEGTLTFMDNTVDASTGTLKLKGTFPNESHRLWPAQFATVTVTLASPEVLTIASSAIQTSQSGQHLYVVKPDKTVELRPVVVERNYEADAVIAKGLTEGETVVIDGQLRVIPGKPVEIKESVPAVDVSHGDKPVGEGGKGKKKQKKET
jgi:multidrug efflux system membrane fusion protein